MNRVVLLFLSSLLIACGQSEDVHENDSSANDSTISDTIPVDTVVQEKPLPAFTDTSVFPAGYEVKDAVYGDLNLDAFTDAIVVFNSLKEEPGGFGTYPRPFLIFLGDSANQLHLALRNDNVTPPQEAGQMFGEPYNGIEIDSGTFTVFHYGGSRFRWTYDYVFEYSAEKKTWFYVKNYATAGDMLGEYGGVDSLGNCIPYDYDTLIVKPKIDIRKFDCSIAPTAEPEF